MKFRRQSRIALLAILLTGLIGAGCAASASAKILRCNGQKILCNQPFNEVVLAGAHNAMSSAVARLDPPEPVDRDPRATRDGNPRLSR